MKNIISVYSGKSGKCCCGCSGKHTYASALREQATKNRGYAVQDCEVSDRSVKIISNKVLSSPTVQHCDDHSFTDDGHRLLIVYYHE